MAIYSGSKLFFRNFALKKPLRGWISSWSNPIKMKRGFEMYCFEDEYTSLYFRLYGDYEAETLDWIIPRLKPDDIFLDVGAI